MGAKGKLERETAKAVHPKRCQTTLQHPLNSRTLPQTGAGQLKNVTPRQGTGDVGCGSSLCGGGKTTWRCMLPRGVIGQSMAFSMTHGMASLVLLLHLLEQLVPLV